jgi:acetyl-CoA synthetase (ADP-forming)
VRAAQSHTASLAGSYDVLRAACERHGVLLTDDPDGMVRAADLLCRWPTLSGDGIGILSSSGGGAGIGVDRTIEAGMRLAALSDETKARLREILLPPQADNPIDLGGRLGGDVAGTAIQCASILSSDPDVAILHIVLTTVPFYEATTRELAKGALASGKPVVVSVTPGSAAEGPRRVLRELGCPYFDGVDQTLRVLRLLVQKRAFPPAQAAAGRPKDLPKPGAIEHPAAGRLTEPEAKRLLAQYGVPVTRETVATDVEAAQRAARDIGFPVVLKAVARDLVHKSDAGGVKLGLGDAAAVAAAWSDIGRALKKALPDAVLDGCLVQEMAKGEAELIVGARRDPQFGPVVLVGFGGIMVEVLEDVQLALAPVSLQQAEAMLRRLRLWPVLSGARGRPPLDVARVADVIARVSWLAADLGACFGDLEINPLLVRRAGEGAIAVDARGTIVEAPFG